MKKKKFVKFVGLGVCLSMIAVGVFNGVKQSKQKKDEAKVAYGLDVSEEDSQYLGYGYDVTAGKPIIKTTDALKLQNPILDVDNPGLVQYTKMKTGSYTYYENYESSSVRETANEYGLSMSAGVNARIKMVDVDVKNVFDLGFQTSKRYEERFAYYTAFVRNRLVYYEGVGRETLSNYLHPSFLSSSRAISSIEDANNFLDKYGTHLVTGYHLGGVFEMTNYFATISSTYKRKVDTSFSQQVGVAMANYSIGVDTSLSAKYGSMDNNEYAVNKYKCTSYGGYAFPGLTIDQAFTVTQSIYGTGFVYQLWTDSINQGKNLIITDIPESTAMIPLFNILPETAEFDNARTYIIKAYIKRAGISYRQFLDQYKDVVKNTSPSKLPPQDIGYLGRGYEAFNLSSDNNNLGRYVPADQYTDTIKAVPNTIISFDFDQATYYGRKLEWKSSNESYVAVTDSRNGVFTIPTGLPTNTNLSSKISLYLDDVQIYEVNINIEEGKYSGGKGTLNDPYILTTEIDIYRLMHNSGDWNKTFRMEDDIVLRTDNNTGRYLPIGNETTNFSGNFDGNYHTIYNLHLDKNIDTVNDGLFGVNSGEISNLALDKKEVENYAVVPNSMKNYYTNTSEPDDENKITPYSHTTVVFGGIAATNSASGKITNCSIKNFVMDIMTDERHSSNSEASRKFDAGLICGINSGEITKCNVENSKLLAKTYFVYNSSNAGGICGRNESSGSISYCSFTSSTIDLQASLHTYDHNTYQYVGGIVGITSKAVNNCLVKNVSRSSNPANYIKCLGSSKNTWGHDNQSSAHVYVAGIAGYLKDATGDNAKFYNCVVVNSASLEINTRHAKSGVEPDEAEIKTGQASFLVNDGNKTATFENCYFEYSGDTIKGYKKEASTSGITKSANLKYKDLVSAIQSDEAWHEDDYGKPYLSSETIDKNSIIFDFSRVKKTFYIRDGVGESFQAGEIKITADTNSGNTIDVPTYKIDFSHYQNNKNTEGTWTISVTACGRSATYQVTSVKVSTLGIEAVEDSAVTLDYHEGDIFNPSGLLVYRLTEAGMDTSASIPYKKTASSTDISKGNFYEIRDENEPLKEGLNTIEIVYTDPKTKSVHTAYYNVYAKKAEVSSVTIDPSYYMSGTGANIVYSYSLPIGTTHISATDLIGLEIKVKLEKQPYDSDAAIPETLVNREFTICFDRQYVERQKLLVKYDAGSGFINKEIDASDVEFIHSTIKSGANLIRVCYNGYLLDDNSSFVVEGVYGDSSEKIQEFTSIINSYNNNDTLENKYAIIKRASALKQELSYLSSDDTYVRACQRLYEIIEQYNAEVRDINNSFDNVVTMSYTFISSSLNSSGFIVLPVLLALLLLVL